MERISTTTARTNKLYCSTCKKKIKKGDNVTFVLDEDYKGKLHMKDCYCKNCNAEFKMEEMHNLAMDAAFGIGQY